MWGADFCPTSLCRGRPMVCLSRKCILGALKSNIWHLSVAGAYIYCHLYLALWHCYVESTKQCCNAHRSNQKKTVSQKYIVTTKHTKKHIQNFKVTMQLCICRCDYNRNLAWPLKSYIWCDIPQICWSATRKWILCHNLYWTGMPCMQQLEDHVKCCRLLSCV